MTAFPVPGEEFGLQNRSAHAISFSLNDVFQDTMKRIRAGYASDLIIRCESLPTVYGNKEEFNELLDHLIHLIFETAHTGNRRFLFVECEEETLTSGGLQDKKFRSHIIRFNTNFSAGDDWKKKNNLRLTRCNEILLNYDGSFIVNSIKNTGCLFLITLPANHK